MRARQFQLTLEPDPFAFGKWKPLLLQLRPQGQTCFPLCLYLFGLSPVFPFQGCRVSLCTFPNLQFPCRKTYTLFRVKSLSQVLVAHCVVFKGARTRNLFHARKCLVGRQSKQLCFSAFLSNRSPFRRLGEHSWGALFRAYRLSPYPSVLGRLQAQPCRWFP